MKEGKTWIQKSCTTNQTLESILEQNVWSGLATKVKKLNKKRPRGKPRQR